MYIVERIGDSAEVRILFLALLPQILILMRSKHRDPLDLLSEYIAKVSTMNLCLFDSDPLIYREKCSVRQAAIWFSFTTMIWNEF